MRKLLLLLLALLAAVGVCQETPSVAWSLQGPPAAPAPAYSPNGSWLVLTSNDGFRVLDATTLSFKWYIPSKVAGTRVPVAKFSRDSNSLFALTDPSKGEVSEIDLATGAVLQKAALFAAGTTPVDLAVLPTTVAAIVPTTPTLGGVPSFQVDIAIYAKSNLAALRTTTLTHSSNLIPYRLATGVRGATEVISFFEQEYNTLDGTVRSDVFTSGPDTFEAWTLGIDGTGGAIQQVQKQGATYTFTGLRRLAVDSSVTWSTTAAALGTATFDVGPLNFTSLPNGTPVAIGGSADSTKLSTLNVNTGAVVFTTDLGLGLRKFQVAEGIANPSGVLATRYSYADAAGVATPNLVRPGRFTLTNSGGAFTANLPGLPAGVQDLQQTGTFLSLGGNYPQVASLNPNGTFKWTIAPVSSAISEPSTTSGHVVGVLSDRVVVYNGATGAQLAFFQGAFIGATWAGDNNLVAFMANGGVTLLKFDGISLGKPRTFLNVIHKSAKVSPDGQYLAGWFNGNAVAFKVLDGTVTTSGLAVANPDAELKVIWLSNTKFAVLTNPSPFTTVAWKTFTIGAGGALTAGADIAHTFTYTTAPVVGGVASDITPDGKYAVFFKAKSVTTNGTPESLVVYKRLTDNVTLAQYLNYLPLTKNLEIAPDGSSLFIALGGATDARGDVIALNAPNTVDSITVETASIYSGLTADLKVTLNRPAKTGGQVVKISTASSGFTYPATVTVPAGATTATFSITVPTVAAQTNFTFSAISGDVSSSSPSASTTVTVLLPLLTSFTVTPLDVFGSELPVVATVNVTGKIFNNGRPTLSSSDTSAIATPANIAINTAGVGSVSIPTKQVTTLKTVTLSATLYGVTLTQVVTVKPPALTAVDLIDAPARGGDEATYRLTLRAAAGVGGEPVAVKIEGPAGTTNIVVTVPEGETTTDFTLTTPVVSTETLFKVTGKTPGSSVLTASTTLLPAELSFIQLATNTQKGTKPVKCFVALDGPAGPATDLVITSSSTRATVPATVRVANGQVFADFLINTTAGTRTTVIIKVKWRAKTLQKTLTIIP